MTLTRRPPTNPKDTPSQILWPWSGWLRTFAIKEYSDAHYMAIEQEPEREDAPGKMYINRLDGKVVLENYISHEAREVLEPIREVSIHDEDLATRRLSMMRIMARWMKAATVLA
jgi:hypothetical protein